EAVTTCSTTGRSTTSSESMYWRSELWAGRSSVAVSVAGRIGAVGLAEQPARTSRLIAVVRRVGKLVRGFIAGASIRVGRFGLASLRAVGEDGAARTGLLAQGADRNFTQTFRAGCESRDGGW